MPNVRRRPCRRRNSKYANENGRKGEQRCPPVRPGKTSDQIFMAIRSGPRKTTVHLTSVRATRRQSSFCSAEDVDGNFPAAFHRCNHPDGSSPAMCESLHKRVLGNLRTKEFSESCLAPRWVYVTMRSTMPGACPPCYRSKTGGRSLVACSRVRGRLCHADRKARLARSTVGSPKMLSSLQARKHTPTKVANSSQQ